MNLLVVAGLIFTVYSVAGDKICEIPGDSQADIVEDFGDCWAFHLFEKRDFPTASETCKKLYNGHLAIVNDLYNKGYMMNYLEDHGIKSPVWIGLTFSKRQDDYIWVDGSEQSGYDIRAWSKGQGSKNYNVLTRGLKKCAALNPKDDFNFSDYLCSAPLRLADKYFICQFPATESTSSQ